MSDDHYEGWTNRETWAVALHINNDRGWQEGVREALRDWALDQTYAVYLADQAQVPHNTADLPSEEEYAAGVAEHAGDIVRENVETTLQEWYMAVVQEEGLDPAQYESTRDDIGSLWRVNWTELGASFLSDLSEQA